MESGWNVKHIVKLIVTSNAYRQSSKATDVLREKDAYNRLIARQSRWRLNAETVRDNALLLSGLLVPKIGGPSVKPYQPKGYYFNLNFPNVPMSMTREKISIAVDSIRIGSAPSCIRA